MAASKQGYTDEELEFYGDQYLENPPDGLTFEEYLAWRVHYKWRDYIVWKLAQWPPFHYERI